MDKAFESIRRGLTEAIGHAKGKQASVRTMRARRSQSARSDTADSAIANALRERADELKRGDDTCQRAARIVEWAATVDGKALRDWMVAFKDQQAAAPTWEQVVEQVQFRADWKRQQYEAALDSAIARWESEVVSDGHGHPAEIDVVEHIDMLAYWTANAEMPARWVRRESAWRASHLKAIETKALELAAFLEEPDGPTWPKAIELFDSAHRPVMSESSSVNEYRARVAGRLEGQQLSQLLRRLAERSQQQARMDARDPDFRDMSRPNTPGAFDRWLARRIRWWFEFRCLRKTGEDLCALIASLMNANRSPEVRNRKEDVTEAQVKDWLRTPRKRALAK